MHESQIHAMALAIRSSMHSRNIFGKGPLLPARRPAAGLGVLRPVAALETICMLIAYAAADSLILEGPDISNPHLFGNLDTPTIISQPTDSNVKENMR